MEKTQACLLGVLNLVKQGYDEQDVVLERYLNMRYQGTDNAIMIQESKTMDYDESFVAQYQSCAYLLIHCSRIHVSNKN